MLYICDYMILYGKFFQSISQSLNLIKVSKTSSQLGGRLTGDTPNKIINKLSKVQL